MHFDVIQISAEKISKDEHINSFDICEDHLYLSESDWGGEEREGDDYTNSLKSLKEEIRPYATVNVRAKTIRFHKPEIVKKQWLKAVNREVKNFKKMFSEETYTSANWQLKKGISELGSDNLFWNCSCQKFSDIIADYLCGYLPQTIYIGAILDAHC